MESNYLPVKILNRTYADKLMTGQVFMRRIREFNCWNNLTNAGGSSDQGLQDGMRSDYYEGTCYMAQEGAHDPFGFAERLPDSLKETVLNVAMVAERQKCTKLFCMTKLEFDKANHSFFQINSRLTQLGDTAVIIHNPQIFYQRLLEAFHRRYQNLYALSANAVVYRNLSGATGVWDIFTKSDRYRWQNEVRIAAKLRDDIFVQRADEVENDPIINIGDISDIAVAVPVSDLLEEKYPDILFSSAVQSELHSKLGIPDGLTECQAAIVGQFHAIVPSLEWISQLQHVFTADLWSPITYMQSIRAGGKPIPRLMFVHKQKKFHVRFGWESIVFLRKDTTPISEAFIRDVIAKCLEKASFPLVWITAQGVYNLGDVTDRYAKYQALGANNQVIEGGLSISERLEIGKGIEQNLFGANCTFTKWKYRVSIDTLPSLPHTVRSLNQIMDQMTGILNKMERLVHMREGNDIYERFCHLR